MKKVQKFIAGLCVLVLIGASYQEISTAIDETKYPPPGRYVDLGGYKLHMQVTGENSGPTVVLEAGGGCGALHFSLVQSGASRFARVVSYDRAGYGWSEASHKSRTSENMVEELHQLLHKSGVPGPYILVGHSLGGMNVRLYASKYPEDVLGVVLVDAVHEDQPYILPPSHKPSEMPLSEKLLKKSLVHPMGRVFIQAAGSLGVLRFFDIMRRPSAFSSATYEIILAQTYRTRALKTALNEYAHFRESQAQLKKAGGILGDKPLIVISAGKCKVSQSFWEGWHFFQKDLLSKSTQSKQMIATESGHKINQLAPEVVVEAIRELVLKARQS